QQYDLYIRHQDPHRRGVWHTYNKRLEVGTGVPMLSSGDEFVAVGTYNVGNLYTYTLHGDVWKEHMTPLHLGEYFQTAANNYVIRHDEEANPDRIHLSYLNPLKIWTTRELPASKTFASQDRSTRWFATNSFAFVLAADNDEFLYTWTPDYQSFERDNTFGALTHNGMPFLLNNSLAAISYTSNSLLARFDGTQWHKTTFNNAFNGVGLYASYGEDVVIFPKERLGDNTVKTAILTFDPNTNTWNERLYDALDDYVYMGNGYCFINDIAYYREATGSWRAIYTIPVAEYGSKPSWFVGQGFHLKSTYDNTLGRHFTTVMFERNRQITVKRLDFEQTELFHFSEIPYFRRYQLAGYSNFITIPASEG
ncbi:MAG: hypothetical protein AAF734_12660, partial [Bacteroidota bacterium]